MQKRTILDDAISPAAAVEALARAGIKVSERALREKARRIGAYRELGQAMFFLPEDLERIMEPERSPHQEAPKPRHMFTGGQSPAGAPKSTGSEQPQPKRKAPSPSVRPLPMVKPGSRFAPK